MFYAIYFFQKYSKVDKIKISYVYVEHEDSENDLVLERKYLYNYVKTLVNMVKAAEEDTEFKKNITKLCDWCPFQELCEKDD